MEPMSNVPLTGPVLQEPVMGESKPTQVGTFNYDGYDFPFPAINSETGMVDGGALIQLLTAAIASNDPRAFLKAAMVEVRDIKGRTFFPSV